MKTVGADSLWHRTYIIPMVAVLVTCASQCLWLWDLEDIVSAVILVTLLLVLILLEHILHRLSKRFITSFSLAFSKRMILLQAANNERDCITEASLTAKETLRISSPCFSALVLPDKTICYSSSLLSLPLLQAQLFSFSILFLDSWWTILIPRAAVSRFRPIIRTHRAQCTEKDNSNDLYCH